jgi:hypothetical protein
MGIIQRFTKSSGYVEERIKLSILVPSLLDTTVPALSNMK